MSARTGADYIAGLKDSRTVWLGDRRIDVTSEPAFAGSLKGLAGYFDWQHRYADACLVEDPTTGETMNASLIVPRSGDDLDRRGRCFEQLARYSRGMLGRTPDYVNVTLAGFVARSDTLVRDGDPVLADRMIRFHRLVAEKDLALTHCIIPPAIDKAQSPFQGANAEMAARIVGRNSNGVIIRGSKVLATLGPFADELFVYPSGPLPPGTDPAHAVCFSIPLDTKGLVTLCRDHYGSSGALADMPFSSRFDEQDAFIIFDDVEVPHERVFVDGDLDVYNALCTHGWDANVMQQTAIRAAVKIEFAYDLCAEIARMTNSDKWPEVTAMLGEIWSYAQLVRASISAARTNAGPRPNGAFLLDDKPMRALRGAVPGWMVRINEIIRMLGSHYLLATPSLQAFDNPELKPLLDAYLSGAKGRPATERAQLFRTAWDFVGSALGGRVELYERFYLNSAARNFGRAHMQAQEEGYPEEYRTFLKEAGIA